MANKCIAFEGRILKGTTQAKGINNTTRNVSIKEVINLQQAPKIEMAYLKLQFKDEKIGQRLIAEINEQK